MERGEAKVIDIESSALLSEMLDYSEFPYKLKSSAKLHVVVIRDVLTDEITVLEKENITKEALKEALKGVKYLVHHNGIKFDLIVLKLFGVLEYSIGYPGEPDTLFGEPVTMVDTLILSRLLNPDRPNGHSIESWGKRTGIEKMDYRGECIARGIIPKNAPRGEEFKNYNPIMTQYCILDTTVGRNTFLYLVKEKQEYKGWDKALKMENKLADLAIRRESLGFWFDKDLAIACVEDLTQKMEELRDKVNPLLPPKPMTKTEEADYTAPSVQLKKDGNLSSHMINFAKRIGAEIKKEEQGYYIEFEDKRYTLPFGNIPLKQTVEADISNLDHVKATLIDVYGWIPTEWAVRDFTKDSKKKLISYEKRVKAFNKWLSETMCGKYTKLRLEIAFKSFKVNNWESLEKVIHEKLNKDFPVRLPTSPKVRTGVEKELCPNLVKLGESVSFAKDFALYLTYKHRKSCIAGGEIEDMDFDNEYPNTGYLSVYRESDGRVPTPAIEIGASSHRYRHVSIANVAKSSSVYGLEMRSLFGCGKGFVQLGFDFSSLEARVQGHFVKKYPFGEELAESLVAEKPFDIHSVNSRKLNIERGTVKSVTYAILYGCSPKKLEDMLWFSPDKAVQFYNDYWEAVPALRDLKNNVEKFWKNNGESWIPGIDGRKLHTRSKHSLINLLFQSCGVVAAKYVTVLLMQDMEKQGYCTSPFEGKPDVCSMIEYHDENQLLTSPKFYKFEIFKTEEDAKDFVKNWDKTKGQLSAIGHSDKGYYVTLPNVVSEGIHNAIKKTEDMLKIDVPLGFEWITGKNWAQCH